MEQNGERCMYLRNIWNCSGSGISCSSVEFPEKSEFLYGQGLPVAAQNGNGKTIFLPAAAGRYRKTDVVAPGRHSSCLRGDPACVLYGGAENCGMG